MAIADEEAGKMTCNFKFQFPGTAEEAVFRQANVKVVKSFDEVADAIGGEITLQDESNKVANTLKAHHVLWISEYFMLSLEFRIK